MYRTLRSDQTASADNAPLKGDALIFFVNGRKVIDARPDPEQYLAYYLRYKLNLRGTKIGCNEAQCGSCTVMLSKYDKATGKIRHVSVNSCLVPIASVHGCAITTVEGVGSLSRGLHPVQERLSKGHGSQCGFCTPGFIMAMYSLLRKNPQPTKQDIELHLQGNLCRCTGFRPILESFYGFTKDKCPCGSFACCSQSDKETGHQQECTHNKDDPIVSDWSHCRPYDSTQEPIFPPELSAGKSFSDKPLVFVGPRVTWHRPTSQKELHDILTTHPDAHVAGTYGWTSLTTRVSPDPQHRRVVTTMCIPELHQVISNNNGLTIGAGLTIDQFHEALKEAMINHPEKNTKFFRGLHEILLLLGPQHMRNFSSWTGNAISGWPVSDMAVCLLAIGAILHIENKQGKKDAKLDNTFYLGNGKVALEEGDVVTGVTVPYSNEHDVFYIFKQGQRHGPDGPIVNSAMRVTFGDGRHQVFDAAIAFAGVADRPILAEASSEELIEKQWDENLLEQATSIIGHETAHLIGGAGQRIEYRVVLCMSFFRKFYELAKLELEGKKDYASEFRAVIDYPHSRPMRATQIYQDTDRHMPVGRPIMHQSGEKHTTGEAVYCDDIPTILGECHLALVYSERSHAKIIKVDVKEALKVPGVLTYIDARDIPRGGTNMPQAPLSDELSFAVGEVLSFGQVIGAIVAEDQLIAQRARRLVKVSYQDLPAILTIDDAIHANSYFPQTEHLLAGQNPATVIAFPNCDHVLNGSFEIGVQEHFYMEPQVALVIPKDGDEYEMFCATQALSFAQHEVAALLGVSDHKVTGRIKRIGGGFGGKQTNPGRALHPAALAAHKLKRPARCVLTRHDDFAVTGKRHRVKYTYEVGFNNDGRIQGVQVSAYGDSGWSIDFSEIFLQHLARTVDHCYNIPNFQVDAFLCKTNTPSATPMRGFGHVEGNYFAEELMERVSRTLRMDPAKVREMHFYKDGDKLAFYPTIISESNLQRCWNECKNLAKYEEQRKEVDQFNQQHKWKKRGLSLTPVMWMQGDQGNIIEQGSILVTVYRDGSIQIAHGGTEMGQGLNTKVMQAAACVLNIPYNKMTVVENGTDKTPNAMHTAGSFGSDIYCRAVTTACKEISQRLEPYKSANPNGSWEQWVGAAWYDRCHLAVHAFCKTEYPNVALHCPGYLVYGTACAQVEIDCLTGDHEILDVYIVVDMGDSLNPAVDLGQMEGSFVQGVGFCTMEEILYDKDGRLLTTSAFTYKIPSIATVPRGFHCAFLKNASFKDGTFNSKAAGEPIFVLGYSVHYAIKDAMLSFRADSGDVGSYVDYGSPMTAERIRLHLHDELASMVVGEH